MNILRTIGTLSAATVLLSASARAQIGRFFDSSKVSWATWEASSTSAAVGTAISATTLPSYGLCTSKVPSPVRHSPFTRNGRVSTIGDAPSLVSARYRFAA